MKNWVEEKQKELSVKYEDRYGDGYHAHKEGFNDALRIFVDAMRADEQVFSLNNLYSHAVDLLEKNK